MDPKTSRCNRFKFCCINISGMSEKSRLLLDKYNDEEGFHLIFTQETLKVCKEKLNLTNMRVVTDTNQAKNRGAALYVRNNISLTELPELSKLSRNIDSAWVLVVFNNTRYIIGSVYVKRNCNSAIADVVKMLNEAEQLTKTHKASGVILAGDFNARHSLWGNAVHNSYGNELVDKLDTFQFTIHAAKTPTFLQNQGHSNIDFFITSNSLIDMIECCHTDDEVELGSGAPFMGHLPVLSTLITPTNCPNKVSNVKKRPDIDSINWKEWTKDIEDAIERCENIVSIDNPVMIWNLMEELIETNTQKHCKFKKPTRHSKPYWTQELTTLLNIMKAARKKYNKRNTDPNKAALIEAKENFDLERKKACQDFILEKTKGLNTSEAVAFWKKFNQLFKVRTNKGVDPLKKENGQVVTENSEIEEMLFSTFFESKHLIASNFDSVFYEEVNRLYEEIKTSSFQRPETVTENIASLQSALNAKITISEVKTAIKQTKTSNKSWDNHGMHPKMLTNFGPNAILLLQKLFNSCLEKGEWIWNDAEVIFLKKDGKDSYAVPGAYRPISITSYIGKILEKILASRITTFLEKQGIHDLDQEGFTSKRNTHRYLNRLILDIKNDLRENTVIALFVDLEKAFDSVWKKGLIVKLAKLNFQGKALSLIDNFLSTRKVKLNVNEQIGETRDCKEYGLPQGSALSPVLFKIFLLDFFQDFEDRTDISVFKFADDGTVKMKNKSTQECVKTLQEVANSLHSWTKKWRININCQPNKTEYICFGAADHNAHAVPSTTDLGSNKVNKVPETKVLGLLIDENLTFTSHSKSVHRNILGKWARICCYTNKHWGFNQNVISQIAKTFFLTSLHYAGFIWMSEANMKEIEKLWYKILKSAIGATFNLRKTTAEVILGIPPLMVQNSMNKLKYYLKLNIKPPKEDRVRDLIKNIYEKQNPQQIEIELKTSIKEVFKFLLWKLQNYPNDFLNEDRSIIQLRNYEQFLFLSTKSCSYTKTMINKYTESIWATKINNEYINEGYNHSPKPSCSKLPIPLNTSRKDEVLLMSLFYPNNLFNSNVYRNTYLTESPLCGRCGQDEETPYHIILECSDLATEARKYVEVNNPIVHQNSVTLLNTSRNVEFLKICLTILSQHAYRDQIHLN